MILPSEKPKRNIAVAPVGTLPDDEPKPHDGPVSTYSIWAPFDGPARKWTYGEFHERVGALAAGLVRRGIKPG